MAQFNLPNGACVGPDRAAFVADTFNHRIRRVDLATGNVTTIAGAGEAGYRDGHGTNAQFNFPLGVFVNALGEILVADTGNNRIRKISAGVSPTVTTLAGSGIEGYTNGPATNARFSFPNDLVADKAGNIYVSEFNNHTIRKITPAGEVSTYAGNGSIGFEDGTLAEARLNRPGGLAMDRNGNLFVTEWASHRVRKIGRDGNVTTVAGSVFPGLNDGGGNAARFNEPDGIVVDAIGNLYLTEHGNHVIRKITPEGKVTTVAGTGSAGMMDGEGSIAQFNGAGGIGLDRTGHLVVVDTGNHRVRMVRAVPSEEKSRLI